MFNLWKALQKQVCMVVIWLFIMLKYEISQILIFCGDCISAGVLPGNAFSQEA